LKQQKEIPTGWEDLGIVIGNPDAENEIVKICNTFCTPCSETHKHIDYIVKHKKNTCVRIIYVIPNFDHDAAYAIKHLLAIAEMEQNLTMIDALHDWYSPTKKDYKQFSKKHPIEYEKLEEQSKKLDDMSSWALNAEIQVTPTFFVNRHQLPKNYHISDLKYIL
jgi:protein-disulfide isomerase